MKRTEAGEQAANGLQPTPDSVSLHHTVLPESGSKPMALKWKLAFAVTPAEQSPIVAEILADVFTVAYLRRMHIDSIARIQLSLAFARLMVDNNTAKPHRTRQVLSPILED
ncbi:hypothetical protein H920_18733 [Fukomys damarensis]|uniref:Uncharacterized protein n=1 Tax=Fukomys damarensis TaxID=885580 RepID=A0A091DAP1_FUKDA|nr:hypothetical protein H920_18733 [Fukomys damarensis]